MLSTRRGSTRPSGSTEVVAEQEVRLPIFVRDPDRARAFHAQILDWAMPDNGRRHCWVITRDGDPRLCTDGVDSPDTTGAVHANEPSVPTIHVPDVTAAVG